MFLIKRLQISYLLVLDKDERFQISNFLALGKEEKQNKNRITKSRG